MDLQGDIPTYNCPDFDYNQLLEEDAADEANGIKPNRIGKTFNTNLSTTNIGSWQTVENYKVWRLRISSADAVALKIRLPT